MFPGIFTTFMFTVLFSPVNLATDDGVNRTVAPVMAGVMAAEITTLPTDLPLKVKSRLLELAGNPSTIVATSNAPKELVKVKSETGIVVNV